MLYRGDGRPERGPWDAWAVLAALAAATSRVELGPLVAATAFHPPGLIARMAATIDEVSGGRFRLALGTGWNDEEFRAFGIDPRLKVARFEEAFPIVARLARRGAGHVRGTLLLRRGRRPPASSHAAPSR